MNYNVYKITTPVNGMQAGDDLVSNGIPVQGANGQLMMQGEVYGSGYLGQIANIPVSYLSQVASNVCSNQLGCAINYSSIPTPESNPNAGNIGLSMCYGSTMPVNATGTTTTTTVAPSNSNNYMPMFLAVAAIGGIAYFAVREWHKD